MLGGNGICLYVFYAVIVLVKVSQTKSSCKKNSDCTFGYCQAGHCICNEGWWGNSCEFCRLRLKGDRGVIYDGDGEYATESKCSWVVESSRPNTTITFRLYEFATECVWDHLYIYDGKSINDPLIAAFSGFIRDNTIKSLSDEPVLTVRAKSGSAFVYFYSDKHVRLKGFNISYSIDDDCSNQCGGHGQCNSTKHCICDPGWTGAKCDMPWCYSNCINGVCDPGTRRCNCFSGYKGQSCNIQSHEGYWSNVISNNQDKVEGRASHAVGVIGEWLWVVGGYKFRSYSKAIDIARYNLHSNSWDLIEVSNKTVKVPSQRYGHSVVVYNNSLIVYGGATGRGAVNELWSFDTNLKTWTQITLSADSDKPLPLTGHTATLVDTKMVVLLGYGPSVQVQELDLEHMAWTVFNTTGSFVVPTYGHTSVYDPQTQLIFVHGGFRVFEKNNFSKLSSELNAYNHITRSWHSLVSSYSPRFLHSAVLVGSLMFVYGGNTYNGTANVKSFRKCYSADFVVYDTVCQRWRKIPAQSAPVNAARYGHSAVWANGAMYVFGGFSGMMFNSFLTYNPGNCSATTDKSSCLALHNTSGCVWNKVEGACIGPQEASSLSNSAKEAPYCSVVQRCEEHKWCSRCTASLSNCVWCGDHCRANSCNSSQQVVVKDHQKCEDNVEQTCSSGASDGKCRYNICANQTSCEGCLRNSHITKCMWCESQQKCLVSAAYVVTFPYGQCLEWKQHTCKNIRCSQMKTCNDCHTLPGCGWCDDGSGTGLGQCMEGGDDAPQVTTSNSTLNKCSKSSWYFVECPPCQCNGHSTCKNKNICKACQHQTEGPHCEKCTSGYYGDAKNGGNCAPCQCNGQTDTCDHLNGHCDCLTKGVIGTRCESCDYSQGYIGNVTNGGNCYYQLFNDFHYKFNTTGKSRINFICRPNKDDRDVQFEIELSSGGPAFFNLTAGPSNVITEKEIGQYRTTFSYKDYKFAGSDGVYFYVYVFGIEGNAVVEISFQQARGYLDLLKFFITFFGCFFSLLFLATVVWKIKLRYASFRLTRQRLEEMQQMASRPFATVGVLLPVSKDPPMRSVSSPVAIEPCSTKGAAIATVLMKLPCNENGYTPVGQSGICCAATFIKYGQCNNGKSSRDTRKGRTRKNKSSVSSSTC